MGIRTKTKRQPILFEMPAVLPTIFIDIFYFSFLFVFFSDAIHLHFNLNVKKYIVSYEIDHKTL